MIITPEQAALKAQRAVRRPAGLRPAGRRGRPADRHRGAGLCPATARPRAHPAVGLRRPPGRRRPRAGRSRRPRAGPSGGCPSAHDRRYVSIFGELTIARVVYGTREGQKIERVPLDERLGLPEGDFSYVLEDWGQRLCLKESFAEAGQSLEMLLGLRLGARALEQMNRVVAGYAPSFREALGAAARRGGRAAAGRHRRRQGGADAAAAAGRPRSPTTAGPRGRRRTRSRWPASGRSTASSRSCGRPRTSSTRCCGRRGPRSGPEPQHKHVWAEMTREIEGEPTVTAKEGLFCQLYDELAARNLGHDRPVICLLDGERALWDAQAGVLPRGGRASWTCSTSWSGSGRWPTASTRRGATRPSSSWRSGCGTCCRAGSGT